jgi:hypothetical protein
MATPTRVPSPPAGEHSWPRQLPPTRRAPLAWTELFALANLAFLGLDIALAHAVNRFAHPAEWAPIAFSGVASIILLVAMVLGGVKPPFSGDAGPLRARIARRLGLLVGWVAIAVGVAGLLFHLDSQFFERRTIESLVYTAPFAAPLAYTGVGLLLVLNRMVDARTAEWGRWVVLLALAGFVGNFGLCLADHAQNGFWHVTEWIGVFGAAFAVGALGVVVAAPADIAARRFAWGMLGVQVGVGILGFALHGLANLSGSGPSLRDRFLYGAPIFAPLLFVNLALLAGLGLWGLGSTMASSRASAAPLAS